MENKFREFWICETWDPITCNRRIYDNKPTIFYGNKDIDIFHVVEYAALEAANADAEKVQQSLMKCIEILEDKNKKLSDAAYVADILSQKNKVMMEEIDRLQNENKKLSEQLVICDRAIESLANDRTEAYEIIDKLEAALNKIGMLGMSEHAYTSEFTERVRNIVTEALK